MGNKMNMRSRRKETGSKKKSLAAALVTAAILSLVLTGVAVLSSGIAIQAQEDRQACKMYTSIRIEKGDTLWAIASRYMDGHYSTIQEYIDEVKFINELTSDTIHEDAYLLVPYYQA